MKYYSRLNVYKASNVIFRPDTMEAYSYDWWRFLDRINGLVVLNTYAYSKSTAKHIGKVRGILNSLGIKVDLTVECPPGLQAIDRVESIIGRIDVKIANLESLMARPKSRKSTNLERQATIDRLKEHRFKVLTMIGDQHYAKQY